MLEPRSGGNKDLKEIAVLVFSLTGNPMPKPQAVSPEEQDRNFSV